MKISARHGGEAKTGPSRKTPKVCRSCLLLAMVTLALFFPSLGHAFIFFDDYTYVKENSAIQNGLTPAAVIWAFTTGHASNWHPLTWLSHLLDYEFYGEQH